MIYMENTYKNLEDNRMGTSYRRPAPPDAVVCNLRKAVR